MPTACKACLSDADKTDKTLRYLTVLLERQSSMLIKQDEKFDNLTAKVAALQALPQAVAQTDSATPTGATGATLPRMDTL